MMVSSNRHFISLLSCSCFVLAIVPTTSYGLSTFVPFRTSLLQKQSNHGLRSKPSFFYHPTCTALYSSNPTGRKRRRRKETTGEDTNTVESSDSTSDMSNTFNVAGSKAAAENSNELPDFDIIDDASNPTLMSATNPKKSGSTSSTPKPTVDPLIGTITPNMMTSAPTTNRAVTSTIVSVNELRDRSLEQKLESLYGGDPTLTEQVSEELPDLLTLQKERKKVTTEQILLSASSMSKKERQTLARQQQDMEQQNKKAMMNPSGDDEDDNIFSKLPFITNERGKIEPLKLLEAATWTCIIALVLWEVYINSPLFSRAAPIIPVVYELWM